MAHSGLNNEILKNNEMEMKQLFSNSHYKILEVWLKKDELMPLHKATSDAFIIVKSGTGKIIFDDSEVELFQGVTQLIPEDKHHKLQVTGTFNACIILASQAEIKFL
jgi:mannose-6-phosphate isomerase-like protein (cupin superfamily)